MNNPLAKVAEAWRGAHCYPPGIPGASELSVVEWRGGSRVWMALFHHPRSNEWEVNLSDNEIGFREHRCDCLLQAFSIADEFYKKHMGEQT